MRLVLQTANVVSDAKNCLYPNRVEAGNAAELQEAIKKDHVCGEYKKNYRSKENFIRSNVAVMDCDNDHSEDPEEWITPEKIEELFGDFSYAIAFSRNHMKVKDGKSERPRFHVYFQIGEITDEKVYAGLKIAIQKQYTFFDDNALDAARFIFGADTGEVIWHEGWMTIDEEISPIVETDEPEKQEGTSSGPILQGSRNNTMSRFASRILKRYPIHYEHIPGVPSDGGRHGHGGRGGCHCVHQRAVHGSSSGMGREDYRGRNRRYVFSRRKPFGKGICRGYSDGDNGVGEEILF